MFVLSLKVLTLDSLFKILTLGVNDNIIIFLLKI